MGLLEGTVLTGTYVTRSHFFERRGGGGGNGNGDGIMRKNLKREPGKRGVQQWLQLRL